MKNLKKYESKIYSALSLIIFLGVWIFASIVASDVFAGPVAVIKALISDLTDKHRIIEHTLISLSRSLTGWTLAFLAALPVSFLMGWYKPFRLIVEPWTKFIKSIPPIAYIPLIVVALGLGEAAKITVIFIACFLTIVINIYQGVLNVDVTLIKAAKVLGLNNAEIFVKVVMPASVPFIFVGARLGMSVALTTLIAAELTGAQKGLGMMIQSASSYIQMDVVMLGIVIIGSIGFGLDRLIAFIERKLTVWQETIQV